MYFEAPEETIRAACRTAESANTCFGCTSWSCRSCPLSYENDVFVKPYDSRRETSRRSQRRSRKVSGTISDNGIPVSPVQETAGSIQPGTSDIPAYLTLPSFLFPAKENGSLVCYRADGDGMVQAGIRSGDYLIFDKQRTAADGDIVVAEADGQLVCRRYFHEGPLTRLRREDGSTPDLITENCSIIAVYLGLVRSERGGST